MKKFTLLLVAIIITFSLVAQKPVSVGLIKPSGNQFSLKATSSAVNNSKVNAVYFTSQFNNGGCGNLDSAKFYVVTVDNAQYWVTGSNPFGDLGFAQQFVFSSTVNVVGVAAYLLDGYSGDDETMQVYAMDNSFNKLASVNFETSSISENGDFYQYTFTTPINVNFTIVGVDVPVYTSTSTDIVLSTSDLTCSSNMTRYYHGVDENEVSGWYDITSRYGETFVSDFFIFPITSGTVNIADLDQLTSVYPNPTTDEVSVISSVKINSVEIFNVMGQMVYSSNVNDYTSKINVSDFASGSYIVKMNTESGSINKKLMVK
jgi:hypothetical protein